MKKIILASIVATAISANSQIVNMSNGTTVTCAADFYDSGGAGANYSNNENLSHTFFPATPGEMIEINFASYQSGALDQIFIYDGPDNTYPLLYSGGGTLSIPVIISSDITGAITVDFISNAGGNQAGWIASVSCCSGASWWYADVDGDGFGSMWNALYACSQPIGFVANGDDCDDNSILYEDLDGDGFGNPLVTAGCGSMDNTDCNDTELTYADVDGDTFGDPNTLAACGVNDNTDCDDNDPGVGSGILTMYYQDQDGDGFGTWWPSVLACSPPVGYVDNTDDCDDFAISYEDLDGDGFGNPAVQVGCGTPDNSDCSDLVITYADNDGDTFGDNNVLDPCGVIDNTDCDDSDPGVGGGTLLPFYFDNDVDGYGDPWNSVMACSAPPGYVANDDDCFDWGPMYEDLDGDGFGNPLVEVACGSWDNTDCDDTQITYADGDGDNFGDPNVVDPCGVADNTDCDDTDPGVGGGVISAYYQDFDGDGFGSPWWPLYACSPPVGYVSDSTDCDDWSIMYPDADGDGFGVPGAPVACGSYNDLDCDDALLTYEDLDGDNFGNPNVLAPCGVTDNTDCDDNDNAVGGGIMTAYYSDWDGDLYGSNAWGVIYSCTPVVGYVTDSTDCDDWDVNVNPGETEIAANGIDDNCDGYTDPVVGINEPQQMNFNVYPNPTNGLVFINASGLGDEAYNIKVYDLNGKQILFSQIAISNGETIELNLSGFNSGIYFIQISSAANNFNYKLIVE